VVGAGYEDNCHPYEVRGVSYFPDVNVYRYNYCTSLFDNTPTLFDIGGTETHVAFTRMRSTEAVSGDSLDLLSLYMSLSTLSSRGGGKRTPWGQLSNRSLSE
jgi:hypothetical protein